MNHRVASINSYIEEKHSDYSYQPRKRLRFKRRIFSVMKEATVYTKRGDIIKVSRVEESIKTIRKYLSTNSHKYQQKLSMFESLLLSFKESYSIRKTQISKIQRKCDSDLIKSISVSFFPQIPTLKQILHKNNFINSSNKISISTVRKVLIKDHNVRHIKLSLTNKNRNNENHKIQQFLYLMRISDLIERDYDFVIVDESTYSQKSNSHYLWWNRKENLPVTTKARTKSYNIITAVTKHEIVYKKILEDTATSESFAVFLEELESKVKCNMKLKESYIKGKITLILDNCKIHTGKESKNYMRDSNLSYLFLPTYSPELSCIEYLFSEVKKNLRRIIFESE